MQKISSFLILAIHIAGIFPTKVEITRQQEDTFKGFHCKQSSTTVVGSNNNVHCRCIRHGTFFHKNKTQCFTDDDLKRTSKCKKMFTISKPGRATELPIDESCSVYKAEIYDLIDIFSDGYWNGAYSRIIKKMFHIVDKNVKIRNNQNVEGLLVKLQIKCKNNEIDCFLYKFYGSREYPLNYKFHVSVNRPPKRKPPSKKEKDSKQFMTKKTMMTVLLPILLISFAMIIILLCLLRKRKIGLRRLRKKKKGRIQIPDQFSPEIVVENYNEESEKKKKDIIETFQVKSSIDVSVNETSTNSTDVLVKTVNTDSTKIAMNTINTTNSITDTDNPTADELTCEDIEDSECF